MGPMFANKSSRMIEYMDKHTISKKKCLIIRHMKDIRTNEGILQAHNGRTFNKCNIIKSDNLNNNFNSIKENKIQIVAIDEGQFFDSNDFKEFIDKCNNEQKIEYIYISALNGDFKREPFATVSALIPYCDEIIKLCAVCDICGKKAPFSQRKIENVNDQILIGGKESYFPVCRNCYKCN